MSLILDPVSERSRQVAEAVTAHVEREIAKALIRFDCRPSDLHVERGQDRATLRPGGLNVAVSVRCFYRPKDPADAWDDSGFW